MQQSIRDITRLFWTGGWDSSYRIIELLLFEKRAVQPIYIIDPNRKSIGFELRAMQIIKKLLKDNYPELRRLLLPTKYFELGDIKKNSDISKAYQGVLKEYPVLGLGIQNEWMARLMEQFHLDGVEMGLQKSQTHFFSTFMNLLEKSEINGRVVVKVREELKGTDEFTLFKNFRFALTEITKPEMFDRAKKESFLNWLEQTWFCHNPTPSGKPCGICVPCTSVMKEGMSNRMPLLSKIRYYLRVLLSADQLKKEYPQIHGSVRDIKHLIIKQI